MFQNLRKKYDLCYYSNKNGSEIDFILDGKTGLEVKYSACLQDVSNLKKHVENSYYINSSLAPGFLNRLQGKLSSNANGIESLVNLQKLSNQGITIKSKSVVDYIYFSENNPVSYPIIGMQNWFRIDEAHLDIYDVRDLKG